ncbi:MAG: ParB/RepB/Spo0J family partition protein [Prochloraceae cyanobacterium]
MSRSKRNKAFGGQITTPKPSWLSSDDTDTTSSNQSLVKLSDIHLPPKQPRRYFDPIAEKELVASVKLHGLLQPLLVRPLQQGGYELVAGERRLRAAKEVGMTLVPVVVKELTSEEAWQLALIENLQREDLNPVEETEGLLQLLAFRLQTNVEEVKSLLYRMKNAQDKREKNSSSSSSSSRRNDSPNSVVEETQSRRNDSPKEEDEEKFQLIQEVFESLGGLNWLSFTTKRLPLLNLPEEILAALAMGQIAYTKAQVLARIKDEKLRRQLLKQALTSNWSLSQIKEQVKLHVKTTAEKTNSKASRLSQRLQDTYSRIKKRRIWEDPKKQKQLEDLLLKLEALIDNN